MNFTDSLVNNPPISTPLTSVENPCPILSPVNSSNPVVRSFCTQMTPSQMAEESRKATEEGLKQLANFVAHNRNKVSTLRPTTRASHYSESESDSDSTTSTSSKKRKRSRLVDSSDVKLISNNLENKIRYLKLDLVNAKVEIDEQKAIVLTHSEKLQKYLRIDSELAILNNLIDNSLNNINSYTLEQLENKYRTFKNKSTEHLEICTHAISTLPHQDVASSLEIGHAYVRDRLSITASAFRWIIMKRRLYIVMTNLLITYAIIGSILFLYAYFH
jgi:hypothetical protein